MPVHIVERTQKMTRAERTLWTPLGREPTLSEIAEEAGLSLHHAYEVRAAARASISLDQPVGEQEDAVLGDLVAGEDPLPEEHVEVSLRSQALAEVMSTLPEREGRCSRCATGSTAPSQRRLRRSGAGSD
jgi:RNA polymerase primary sigma factor